MPWSLLSGELLHQVLQQNPVEKHCEKTRSYSTNDDATNINNSWISDQN